MRKFKFLVFIISFIFIILSCKNDDPSLSSLYNDRNYQETLSISKSIIEKEITKEALYYKALSEYHLSLLNESVNTAKLYTLLYDGSTDNDMRRIRQIILYYGDREDIVVQGERINKDYRITYFESLAYFTALMELKLYDRANEFYSSIVNQLSTIEELKILLSGKANSTLIISSLTQYYNEVGLTDDFKVELYNVIDLLLERGEGNSILHFCISIFDSTPYFALRVGDIYLQNNQITMARNFWAMAQEEYPSEVRARLFSVL